MTGIPSVSFVSSYGNLGGSEIYLMRLLESLDSIDVRSVISLGQGPLLSRLRALGYEIDVVPTSGDPWSFIGSARRVRRLLLRAKPDVVHANGLKATLVARLAAMGTTVGVVWVRHDFSMEGWRARLIARACRRVVCVSHRLARAFSGNLGRKVDVVYTGLPQLNIDRETARARVLEIIEATRADPVISLVGRMIPSKGHIELIEIAPRLLNRFPAMRILFVGGIESNDAGYVQQLRNRIENLGLTNSVTFIGHRDDALTLIAGSDLVVAPNVSSYAHIETEGFPIIGLEALAVGTPVVAYAVGGFPELLADCGFLVTPGDREALLEAIQHLSSHRELCERLSHCGTERAQKHFSMQHMVDGLLRSYQLAARS